MLCMAPAMAAENVEIHVDNARKPYRNVAFWYIYGDRISWWQGGAKFILDVTTDEYKTIEEFMIALPEKLGIEVVAGELHLIAGYLKAEYAFNGIVKFKDFLFVDNEGRIVVEWEYKKGLNVTFYSKATVDLSSSSIAGYGYAGWKKRILRYVEICIPMVGCKKEPLYDSTPTAIIPIGSEVLVVPTEGVVLEEVHRGYVAYLGGGPNLDIADANKNIKAGQIFWDREPDYWLVYNAKGLAEIWKVDNWFNKAVFWWPLPHEVKVVSAR